MTAVIQFGLWFDKGFLVFLFMRGLAGLFNFCWTMAGSVWVFGIWSEVKGGVGNFCDKSTYMFSFYMLILFWVVTPIICLLRCLCWMGCTILTTVAVCLGLSQEEEN